MFKRFIILLFSSFIGIISGPEILATSDNIDLVKVVKDEVVEAAPVEAAEEFTLAEEVPEEEPVEEVVEAEIYSEVQEVAYTAPAPAPVIEPAPVAPAPVVNNIQITGRTLNIVDVDSTLVDAGDHVNKYGAKFLYGHNSERVFGHLKDLGASSTFTVTYGGVTTTYAIQQIVIFDVIFDEAGRAAKVRPVGVDTGNYMNRIAEASYGGNYYDLSIMTCHGATAYGTSVQRLVIFANAI